MGGNIGTQGGKRRDGLLRNMPEELEDVGANGARYNAVVLVGVLVDSVERKVELWREVGDRVVGKVPARLPSMRVGIGRAACIGRGDIVAVVGDESGAGNGEPR